MRTPLLLLLAVGLTSCPQSQPEEPGCTLALDGLSGTTWVMYEALHGIGDVENPQARAKFVTEDGQTRVKYTVKSLGDVYTYDCTVNGDEIECVEPIHL